MLYLGILTGGFCSFWPMQRQLLLQCGTNGHRILKILITGGVSKDLLTFFLKLRLQTADRSNYKEKNKVNEDELSQALQMAYNVPTTVDQLSLSLDNLHSDASSYLRSHKRSRISGFIQPIYNHFATKPSLGLSLLGNGSGQTPMMREAGLSCVSCSLDQLSKSCCCGNPAETSDSSLGSYLGNA